MPIGLLIADEHELIREGLRGLVGGTGIEIVGEAAAMQEVKPLAERASVDVLLLAVSWRGSGVPSDHGPELLREIRVARPELPILMYSVYDWISLIERCRQLRANGYLVKGVDDRRIAKAVKAVYRGDHSLWADRRGEWRGL